MAASLQPWAIFLCRRSNALANEFGYSVDGCSGYAYHRGEQQRVQAEDALVACSPHCKGDQQSGSDARGDGACCSAGNAKGAVKIGLAVTQDDEGDEL